MRRSSALILAACCTVGGVVSGWVYLIRFTRHVTCTMGPGTDPVWQAVRTTCEGWALHENGTFDPAGLAFWALLGAVGGALVGLRVALWLWARRASP